MKLGEEPTYEVTVLDEIEQIMDHHMCDVPVAKMQIKRAKDPEKITLIIASQKVLAKVHRIVVAIRASRHALS